MFARELRNCLGGTPRRLRRMPSVRTERDRLSERLTSVTEVRIPAAIRPAETGPGFRRLSSLKRPYREFLRVRSAARLQQCDRFVVADLLKIGVIRTD